MVIAVVLACTWAWTKHAKAVNEHALAAVASQLAPTEKVPGLPPASAR